MNVRTRIGLGAAAAIIVAGGAAGAATATAQASSQTQGQLTFTVQPADLEFFGNSGPIGPYPTSPLVPGDRIVGQDSILQGGKLVGHDNEECTVSFNGDVLCQDIFRLDGQGDVQASWALQWPANGGAPATYEGIIEGGTGRFSTAHGTFHASALAGGGVLVTATVAADA
jgi:hypothetical protein